MSICAQLFLNAAQPWVPQTWIGRMLSGLTLSDGATMSNSSEQGVAGLAYGYQKTSGSPCRGRSLTPTGSHYGDSLNLIETILTTRAESDSDRSAKANEEKRTLAQTQE